MTDGRCPNVFPLGINQFPLLRDVVGKPREFLEDIIDNIEGEIIFTCMGTKPDKSFLLYGPPGTGKTYCIKALNNEMNYNFMINLYETLSKNSTMQLSGKEKRNEVLKTIKMQDYKLRVFEYSIGQMGTAYINVGSRRVQDFFNKMFHYSRQGFKTLVVLDEVDSLLIDRKGGLRAHSEDHKILETIMKNLQTANDEKNMYVVMMSNMPEICDEASLRAGRIDKKYKFDLPYLEQRKEAFDNFINQKNEFAMYKVIRQYDTNKLAEETNDFNYADILSVVDSAIKQRAKEVIRTRKNKIIPAAYIRQNRLEKAIKEHKINFKKQKKEFGFRAKIC